MNKALEDLQAGRDPFAPRPEEDRGELFRNLAKWSRWLVILAGVLMFVVSHSLESQAGDRSTQLVRLVTGGICMLMMAASLVLGVIALFAIRKYGTEEILRPALIGVSISVFCIYLFGFGFMQGVRNARARAELKEQANQIRARERMDYTNHTEITASEELNRVNQAQNILNQAAKNSTGDQALITQAMSSYLAKAKILLIGLAKTAEPVHAVEEFDMSNVTQQDQLRGQIQQVKDFLAANEKLLKFTQDTDNILIGELQNVHLSQKGIDETMRGYHRGVAGQNELAIKIRLLDKRTGEAVLSALGILNDNWGKWRYSTEQRTVLFDDHTVWKKYIAYLKDAGAAQKELTSVQRQLLGLKSK